MGDPSRGRHNAHRPGHHRQSSAGAQDAGADCAGAETSSPRQAGRDNAPSLPQSDLEVFPAAAIGARQCAAQVGPKAMEFLSGRLAPRLHRRRMQVFDDAGASWTLGMVLVGCSLTLHPIGVMVPSHTGDPGRGSAPSFVQSSRVSPSDPRPPRPSRTVISQSNFMRPFQRALKLSTKPKWPFHAQHRNIRIRSHAERAQFAVLDLSRRIRCGTRE